ncbi:MAG TPA: GNAT family N-acetyltransferase [Gemmatimonadales bacterium]|nr:GNAT family N-acetyltransferase [Gemmatimonadales bacterium]
MAWQPDREVWGPERPGLNEIEPLNRVFSESFTDRYRRDGMTGVRVPYLHNDIWRYALEDAAEGAMVWRDAEGHIIAFNMAHRSGAEGWMGPLAVRSDWQERGIGTEMLKAGIAWLRGLGVRTLGLETMPRTIENIGFYSRLGFEPGMLTITLVRDLPAVSRVAGGAIELMSAEAGDRLRQIEECRRLADALSPGLDFSRELVLTHDLRLGDAVFVRNANSLSGFALYHSAPLAAGRGAEELRVLKLVATDPEAFGAIISAVETAAVKHRLPRVAIRCQTAFQSPYHALVDRGYRVHWTDLRMTLEGFAEPAVRNGAVVWSNWEV